jgi:hypothetical protein
MDQFQTPMVCAATIHGTLRGLLVSFHGLTSTFHGLSQAPSGTSHAYILSFYFVEQLKSVSAMAMLMPHMVHTNIEMIGTMN